MKSFTQLVLIFLFSHFSLLKAQNVDWLTYYEKSDYLKTPRYDETIKYAQKLASASPIVSYQSFGISPQGRDLPLLILDKNGYRTVDEVRQQDKAVILIQAGIHAGESDGKDSGLMLLRDMAIHGKFQNLLDQVTILFIPIFNVDGHERFGKYNRINQNGPEEMGWRATSQRLNLNRDYLKADAPEMQALITLYQEWIPDFSFDCHVTDGADYIYPLTYGLLTNGNLNKGQTEWLKNSYLPYVEDKMQASNNPIAPYMDFVEWHNPKSGLKAYMESPRYSCGYAAINNRVGLLIETHMLKDYKTRVTATYEMLLNSLELFAQQKDQLLLLNKHADEETANFNSENPYVLTYKPIISESKFRYEGFEYAVEKSDLSGGDWYKYSDRPESVEIPYYYQVPDRTVMLPKAYIVPVEFSEIISKLELHNVTYKTLKKDTLLSAETYKFTNVTWNKRSFEGRVMLNYKVESVVKQLRFEKGSIYIPLDQRAAQLVVNMLEPMAPDSFVRWGFMNTIFEQKEYAESYVMEKMAREMLKNDPELKIEFENKLQKDNDFATSPNQILNWFYQKSPYWDENVGIYPIGRLLN